MEEKDKMDKMENMEMTDNPEMTESPDNGTEEDGRIQRVDFGNTDSRNRFDDSLYCRFGEPVDSDQLKGKFKDRYVLFYSDLSGRPFPITKTFLKWNRLEKEDIIRKAYPRMERIHVAEFTGQTDGIAPDYVVYEDRCGAAALLLDEFFVRLSREQNLLIVPHDLDHLWVYRLNGAGPLSVREKAKAAEIAKQADSMYYYDAMNEEIHRLKVD